jgi:hypothetical protein
MFKNKYGDAMKKTIEKLIETEKNATDLLEFERNSKLTENERLLRKNGLKDDDGEFTRIAHELVEKKLMSDNEEYLLELIGRKTLEEGEEAAEAK